MGGLLQGEPRVQVSLGEPAGAAIRQVECHPRARGPDFAMPITILDMILIGVMLISALLAMIRGFMREILSIAAWVIAGGGDPLFLCQAPALRQELLQQRHRGGRASWSAAPSCSRCWSCR